MKDKIAAGLLALFLGGFGVHRFYLNQGGRGLLYLIFCWFPLTWLIALIDAIILLTMDQAAFDLKYNRPYYDVIQRQQPEERNYHRPSYNPTQQAQPKTTTNKNNGRIPESVARKVWEEAKPNPFKNSGINKFKNYDYTGAIEDFEKALEMSPRDIAIHFNLACAYSLNENASKSLHHLDQAVAMGFTDIDRIRSHDALAFVRVQPQFDAFVSNGYRLPGMANASNNTQASQDDTPADLLEQIKKLHELREKGLLTEAEYTVQRKRLMP